VVLGAGIEKSNVILFLYEVLESVVIGDVSSFKSE